MTSSTSLLHTMSTPQNRGDLGFNGFPVSLFYLASVDTENITDPNVTIIFKNITKKNAVTKEKRLAELLKMLEEGKFDINDYFILVCWIQIYPRLAIDSLKPVRLLVHQIQATYLEKMGGKEFSKYLKSTIPVWLQSLYDDKAVSKSSYGILLQSFQDDKEKVERLWIIFHEQIINYCHALLVVESATSITDERSETVEEVNFKYERAMNAAIRMLKKVISTVDNGMLTLSDSSMTLILEILLLEKLWDHLESCSSSETLNTQLFGSMLVLIHATFARSESGVLSTFTQCLDDLKSIYKLVSKKFIKHIKLTANSPSAPIAYAPVIIPFWEALIALTSLTGVEPSVRKSLKLKKNFWQLGGSKSYTRLKGYLKLGSCHSSPLYYASLKTFFLSLSAAAIESDEDFSFLDFGSSKDASLVIEKILLPQFHAIRLPHVLRYKQEYLDFIQVVWGIFSEQIKDSDSTTKLSKKIFIHLLDGLSLFRVSPREASIQEQCLVRLGDFGNEYLSDMNGLSSALLDFLSADNELIEGYKFISSAPAVCSSFLAVLSFSRPEEGLDFVNSIIDKTDSMFELEQLSKCFKVLADAVRFSASYANVIAEWMPGVPSFVTEDFTMPPLSLLDALLEKNIALDCAELTSDFIIKYSQEAPLSLQKLLILIGKHNLPMDAPDAREFLVALSKKPNRLAEEDKVTLRYVGDREVLANLASSCSSDQLRLISALVEQNIPVEMSSEALEVLVLTAIDGIHREDYQRFLNLVSGDMVKMAIYQHIVESDARPNFEGLVLFLSQNPAHIPTELLKVEIEGALKMVDLSTLAIGNLLQQNSYLIEASGQSALKSSVIPIAEFLHALVQSFRNIPSDLVQYYGLAIEYVQDYGFLLNVDSDKIDYIVDLGVTLISAFSDLLQLDEIGVVKTFNEHSENQGLLELLSETVSGKGPFSAKQFYSARLLVRPLTTLFEQISLESFEALEVNYTRLVEHPLKLAIYLSSANKFISSSKLDRIKNYLFGELLGVKSSTQIMDSGIKWLALATNFVNVEPEDLSSSYTLMPGHKLGMLITQLSGWLESDIAYDSEFVSMRGLLAYFLSRLIPIAAHDLPDKTWELAVDLCLNNLSTAQIEQKRFDLKYFSMKLYVALAKHANAEILPLWEESKLSVLEELLDLMLNKEIEELNLAANNQLVILFNDQMERVLKHADIPKMLLADSVPKFFDLLMTSKFVNLQRLSVIFLQKHILETQQDFVVEYQLSKSNLGLKDFDDSAATLPSALVQTVTTFEANIEDSLDDEEYSKVVRYLWSWLLVFDHFTDTTFSIKADYINQIKADGAIERLLNTIFNCVSIADNAFLGKLVTAPLEKHVKAIPGNSLIQLYNIHDGCIGELFRFEMSFLLLHLYYLAFQHLGSYVQQWFNGIRDLQLKQQVEKFSVRFVSPILISKMMDDVSQVKNRLTEKDENLTIKVNTVTHEIKSVYVIDEQTMEMVVKIPETFPLSNVMVEGPVRLGVKDSQWKAWLLASQRVISLTNGSIIDCIELFNRNVNLHFSGFEECAICYSILHQDHSLPSKVCPTCLNKFHAACLYKWFKSSGSSTCPLCRSAFNFKTTRA